MAHTPVQGTRAVGSSAQETPEFLAFLDAARDAAELRAAANVARELLRASGPAYGRLSDLLDEVLPTDKGAQDRIARALSLASSELEALRRSRLDPLAVSPYPLMCLADVFGLDFAQFRRLVESDHARFAKGVVSERGGVHDEANSWNALEQAWERLTAENPARFTAPE